MRRIERTTAFRRDFKREKRGSHRSDPDSLVFDAVSLLAEENRCPSGITTMLWPATGRIIGNAI